MSKAASRLYEVASQAKNKNIYVLLPGLNPLNCADQPEPGMQREDRQTCSKAVKSSQDWWRVPYVAESSGNEPIGRDLLETAGKLSRRGKQ